MYKDIAANQSNKNNVCEYASPDGYVINKNPPLNAHSTIFSGARGSNFWLQSSSTSILCVRKQLRQVCSFAQAHLSLCCSTMQCILKCRAASVNTHHNSNLNWLNVSPRVDEVIPLDHPRREASRVIQWNGLIHET